MESDAEKHCAKSRQILPITYNDGKKKRAQTFHSDCDDNASETDVNSSIQEDKEKIRKEIETKMNAIHNMFFDLSDDEIDAIQETIGNEDAGEDLVNDIVGDLNYTQSSDSESSTNFDDTRKSNKNQLENDRDYSNDNTSSGV